MRESYQPVRSLGEDPVSFIDRTRYSIYDDITSSALEKLMDISFRSPVLIPLVPSHPGFEYLSQEEQNRRRHLAAKGVFKPLQISIDTALTREYFDPQELYDTCGLLFRDAGALNPLPRPLSHREDIPFEEVDKMRKIREKDPTNIRFFNKGLPHLPHAMRVEFRRLGITLLIIQGELIPELAAELEKQGTPRTYGKKGVKKVEVVSESPLYDKEYLDSITKMHERIRTRKIKRKRRRTRGISSTH